MFWLLPPPRLRWLAAAMIFAGAAYLDFALPSLVAYPFAGAAIESGAPVEDHVEWRDVPAGLLPPPAPEGFAARDLTIGEPLTAAAVRSDPGIPAGWWSVPVDVPLTAGRGAAVRLVAPESGLDVAGFVTEPASTGAFASVSSGLVAVPPEVAAEVATASANGRVIVLLET